MEINKPRGTRDFLFDEMNERKSVEEILRKVFEIYGYQEIKTPLFEDLSLFTLKSGEGIMEQIYHFQDKGGRELALRPELTAPVSRLYLNQLQKSPKPLKMYYFGSCFRYERPQAGRFRQFWQMGCELIGAKSPYGEGEVIAMAAHCLEELGLKNYEIHLGNLGIIRGILQSALIPGDEQDQIMALIDKGEVDELKNFLSQLKLDQKHQNILLKLIGMKGHREVIVEVREIIDSNQEALAALNELEKLLDVLDSFGFSDYIVNLGIARGLDYYSGMVFEIYVPDLGAQKQISGGGTYNLIELFGGEEVGSTGFAFGFDRVMEALKNQKTTLSKDNGVEIFVAPISADLYPQAFQIATELRKTGLKTVTDLSQKKFKKMLSYANNLGVKFVVLVGERDLEQGKVTIKNMETGKQSLIARDEVVSALEESIKR